MILGSLTTVCFFYNRYRTLLSLVFRLGMENEKINANPARLIKHRLESSGRVRWLTVDEEVALRRAIEADPEWHKRLPDVVIGLNTEMPLSEQIGLDWSQVDLGWRVIWITLAKNGKGRYVRLNTQAVEAFKDLLARNIGEKRGEYSPTSRSPTRSGTSGSTKLLIRQGSRTSVGMICATRSRVVWS